jgi:hypothetical protein
MQDFFRMEEEEHGFVLLPTLLHQVPPGLLLSLSLWLQMPYRCVVDALQMRHKFVPTSQRRENGTPCRENAGG